MRVRSHIAAAIVPLFLGLSIVTGALTYHLQVKELTWGLDEESTSIAVSAARLIDGAAVRRIAAGEEALEAPVRDQFRRILAWGRARRLTLLAGADLRVLVDVFDGDSPGAGVATPSPAVAAALERQPFVSGTPAKGAGGALTLTAFAPVRDAAGALLGILAVETRADTFASRRDAVLRSVLISLCAATLLGLLLAVLISRMITRRLSDLTDRVRQVETGGEVPGPGTGIIDEVNDLVNTFDTIQSVLGEVLAKTRRTLIETEQFRTEEDLMGAYLVEFQGPARTTVSGLDAAGSLFGRRPTGSFFGVWDLPGGGCAFVGTVGEQGLVERTVAGAAALAHLRQASRNGAVGPALASTAELFPGLACEGASWGDRGADVVRWSLGGEGGAGKCARVDLQSGATVVLHTMGAPADGRIDAYVGQFRRLSPDALLGEVVTIVDEGLGGALLLLQPSPTVSPVP